MGISGELLVRFISHSRILFIFSFLLLFQIVCVFYFCCRLIIDNKIMKIDQGKYGCEVRNNELPTQFCGLMDSYHIKKN